MVFPLPPNLVKTLARKLAKNLVKNLAKNLRGGGLSPFKSLEAHGGGKQKFKLCFRNKTA